MKIITATIEEAAQLDGVLNDGPHVSLVYIESGLISPSYWKAAAGKIHLKGARCGLRLPHIWRDRASVFFNHNKDYVTGAGFDVYLFRNMEALVWFGEHGILTDGTDFALDHSIYIWNSESLAAVLEMIGISGIKNTPEYITLPLELSINELCDIDTSGIGKELVVYGRAPMMVSAQCLKRNLSGCDGKPSVLTLKDRTGAMMPVKNSCAFCMNTIYNSVPAAIYDLHNDIKKLSPSSLRYEFTVESPEEITNILRGRMPASYTRGRARKGAL